MVNVIISELTGKRRQWEHTARTANKQLAIRRAITKHFGRNAGFWSDPSLGTGTYGQITEPARSGGRSCVTERVKITIAS